jgi:branched-chain amino acid transport system substrate-binding protein
MAGYVECLNSAVQKGLWKPEKKLVAILAEDTDWGRDVGRGFKNYFTQTGWQIASEDYVAVSQTEFYPVLNKYKQSGVSVIAGSIATGASIAAYTKQAKEIGIEAVMIDDGLSFTGGWYKLTGEASNGILDMAVRFMTPEAKEWAKSFETKYKIEPSPACGGLIFDSTNFFIKAARRAIEKYGTLDKESLHKIMVEEIYTGKLTYGRKDGGLVMQELRYNAESIPDAVFGQDAWFLPIVQFMKGDPVIVYPDNIKEKDFMPPSKNK